MLGWDTMLGLKDAKVCSKMRKALGKQAMEKLTLEDEKSGVPGWLSPLTV